MTRTAAARPVLVKPVPRGGMGVDGFYSTCILATLFPLAAGIVLYGWRGAAVVGAVMASAALAALIWRGIGPRGHTLHFSQITWFSMLLGLMLPAALASGSSIAGMPPWPLPLLAGLLLVILLWLFGGLGGGHVHPVLATYLLIVICFSDMLTPRRVLNRDHLLTGDLGHWARADTRALRNEPWLSRPHGSEDAEYQEPAAEALGRYTSGREAPPRKWLSLPALLRDSMPPLEDFIVAGQPGPIGASSVIAVIIGGLFLLYRGMIDYRIPLLMCAAAFAALLILPVPTVIADAPQWRWFALRVPDIGWSVAVTFASYEIMASPLVFTAFFLATAPMIRPMTRRGRTIFAIGAGAASAALQLYVSVSYGPYLATLIVSLLTPELDNWFRAKPSI